MRYFEKLANEKKVVLEQEERSDDSGEKPNNGENDHYFEDI